MTREEAIDLLDNLNGMIEDSRNSDYDTAFKMAIKALEHESILDKIRAEIMQLDYDIESVDYDHDDMPQTEIVHTICREEVLHIIAKYKDESEDK